MAKYSSSVNYKITTSLDASGITRLQAELNKLESEFTSLQKRKLMSDSAVNDALSDIRRIERALDKAFNPRLGMMNTKTLMTELTAGGRSLNQIYGSLGTRGTAAMAQLHGQLGKIDTGMKSVSKTTDKVFNTIGNTVRWGIIASGFQYMMNSAHAAVKYMGDLDKSLTNIRMVTDESKESMRQFAQYANDAAKSLGSTTVAYTDAALIYAQQGYGLEDQKALADYTIMTANATGQGTAEVSEQMTSLINGFQLSVEEVGGALDVMAKVANTSAADLEELATATSKVASTANTLGVTQEQLTAQIATVVSVTREAPENVGNALKTIYARFGDLQLGETLEDGTDLGKVSSTLEKIGVQVLDSSGKMRDMGLIIEDLMAIWDTLDTATKQGAAVTLAGKYQYNRLMALMENSDMYEGYYDDAINSAGTLEEMQSEYMESLAGKANALKASFEGLISDLFNQDDFGGVLEGLTAIVDKFDELVEAIGGGSAAFTAFGAIGMNVFKNQIGRGISNFVSNQERGRLAKANIEATTTAARAQLSGAGVQTDHKAMNGFIQDTAKLNVHAGVMSDEQIQRSNEILERRTQAIIHLDEVEKKYKQTTQALNAAYHMLGVGQEAAEQGALGFLKTLEADGVGVEEAKEKVSQYSSALTKLQSDLIEVSNALGAEKKDSGTYFARLIDATSKASKNLEKLKGDLVGFGVSEEQVTKLTKVLQQVTDGESVSASKLGKILKENDLTMDSLRQSLVLLGDSSKMTAADFEKLITTLHQARAGEKALAAEHQGLALQMQNQSMASHVASMASGVMSLAFAIQSLQALGSIWSNEDLTLGEKLEQSWMNGLMTVAMLSMAYVEMSTAIRTFKEAQAAASIVQAVDNALTQISITQKEKLAAREAAVVAAEGRETAATLASAAATEVDTAATAKNAAAKTGLLQKLGGVILNAAKLHPVVAGLSIAFVAGAAAIKLYTWHAERFDRAIEEAEESASFAKDTMEATQASIDSINTALEAVQSNKDAFKGLEKGTAAWVQQLREANNTILSIIEEFPELAKYVTIDPETGALSFNEEGLEEYLALETSKYAGNAVASGQAEGRVLLAESDKAASAGETLTADDLTNLAVSISDEDIAALTAHNPSNVPVSEDGVMATLGDAYNNWQSLHEMLMGYGLSKDQAAEILNNETLRESVLGFVSDTEQARASINALGQAALTQSVKFQELTGAQQGAMSSQLNDWMTTDYRNLTEDQTKQLTDWGIDLSDEDIYKKYAEMKASEGYVYDQGLLKKPNEEGVLETADISVDEAYNEYVANQVGKYFEAHIADLIPNIKETANYALTGSTELSQDGSERTTAVQNFNSALASSDLSSDEKLEIIGTLDQDSTTEEINKAVAAINEGKSVEEIVFAAGGEEGLATLEEEANAAGEALAESFEIDLDEFKAYRDLLAETYPELKENAKALNEVAVANKRMEKGVKALADDWEELDSVMSDSTSSAEDISSVLPEINDGLQDILNISNEDFELLPADFAQKNWGLIQDVVNGVEGSIDELRNKAGEDILLNVGANVDLDADDQLDAAFMELHNKIAGFDQANFTVGVSIDPASNAKFYAACNEMINAAGMTATQAQSYFASMGYDVELTEVDAPPKETPWHIENPQLDEEATKEAGVPIFSGTETLTGTNKSGGGKALAIKTITPNGSYGGGVGVNSVAPSTARGGGSGGGGGGGGGGKKYEPKKKEKIEDKPDRYQNVNSHMDRLSKSLEKIANEEDRLAGKDMLDNLEQQAEIIEKQARWQQRKLEIQQQEAAELRSQLSSDFGIKFDSEGFMTNYQAMHNKLVNKVNNLIAQYNAATTEAAQEALESKIEEAQKELDEFNETWERYNELMNNEIPESQNALEEYADQIEDLRIKAFQATVEATDNIKAVKDAWADYMGFMSGYDPDSPFRALTEDAERYENALESVGRKQEDLEYLLPFLSDYEEGGTISKDNPFGENSAEYYEALKEAYESYIEGVLEAEQLYYDQINDVIEGYDDIVDRISDRMEKYARLTEQLDHYASMVEMVYGEEDYDKLLALKRANQDVLESSIKQSSATLTMLEQELAKMEAAGAPQKIIDDLKNKVVEAEQELEGLMEEAAQNIAEILEMAVDKTVKEWKDSMLGGDADWMETQWELAKRNADQYLDTVEETYEIEKLRSKYNSLANDTTDLNIRKRINDQMQKELAYLQEKDKLSEYDVNYANAKLEILQKQIALEEAQANKNQMKLRRDSQGNYNYVYAGDQDNIEDARNDLLDAEFNAYSMSKDNYITNYDNYISAVSQAAEQIKAINADVSLSEEEKAKRTQAVYDNLAEYLKGVAEQIGVSEQNMIEAVKYLAMDSGEIVGQTYVDIAAMMEESWTEALGTIGVAVSEEFDHIIHNIDDFLDDTKEKWDEFTEHTEEWAKDIQDIAEDGTDAFLDIDDVIIDINDDMKDLNESTAEFFSLINDDLGTIDAAVGRLADYERQIQGLKNTTSKIRAELEKTKRELAKKEEELRIARGESSGGSGSPGGSGDPEDGGPGGGGGGGPLASEANKIGIAQAIWTYGGSTSGWGNDPIRSKKLTKNFGDAFAKSVQDYINENEHNGKLVNYNSKKFFSTALVGYDTGGYTGTWEDGNDQAKNGKLAWLHQKELVLNATDTENILNAVSLIRDVVNAIKLDSISSAFASLGGNKNIATNTGNNVQQNIEIYADFPAAESAAEIKAALEGLAQQAVQYSFRER